MIKVARKITFSALNYSQSISFVSYQQSVKGLPPMLSHFRSSDRSALREKLMKTSDVAKTAVTIILQYKTRRKAK